MRAAANWANETNEHRGSLIRYYWVDPAGRPPANAAAALDARALGGEDRGWYNINHHPLTANINAFKLLVLRNYREYIDGLSMNFKTSITDEDIGILYGTNVDPTAGAMDELSFINRTGGVRPTMESDDAHASGLAHENYVRTLEELAVTNPDQYVKRSNDDLKSIETTVLQTYRGSFQKYYTDYKMTKEDAHKYAMKDKDEHQNLLIRQHNLIYKQSLLESAGKKILKQVT